MSVLTVLAKLLKRVFVDGPGRYLTKGLLWVSWIPVRVLNKVGRVIGRGERALTLAGFGLGINIFFTGAILILAFPFYVLATRSVDPREFYKTMKKIPL